MDRFGRFGRTGWLTAVTALGIACSLANGQARNDEFDGLRRAGGETARASSPIRSDDRFQELLVALRPCFPGKSDRDVARQARLLLGAPGSPREIAARVNRLKGLTGRAYPSAGHLQVELAMTSPDPVAAIARYEAFFARIEASGFLKDPGRRNCPLCPISLAAAALARSPGDPDLVWKRLEALRDYLLSSPEFPTEARAQPAFAAKMRLMLSQQAVDLAAQGWEPNGFKSAHELMFKALKSDLGPGFGMLLLKEYGASEQRLEDPKTVLEKFQSLRRLFQSTHGEGAVMWALKLTTLSGSPEAIYQRFTTLAGLIREQKQAAEGDEKLLWSSLSDADAVRMAKLSGSPEEIVARFRQRADWLTRNGYTELRKAMPSEVHEWLEALP